MADSLSQLRRLLETEKRSVVIDGQRSDRFYALAYRRRTKNATRKARFYAREARMAALMVDIYQRRIDEIEAALECRCVEDYMCAAHGTGVLQYPATVTP